MPKFCCFNCPAKDYANHDLNEMCPSCGHQYGFPLVFPPVDVGNYKVIRPLRRGFYSAAYLVVGGALETNYVAKISPKSVYTFFKKDFVAECRLHKQIAEDSEHVVPIRDMFDEVISFGTSTIACHVAILDLVEGDTLQDLVTNKHRVPARTVAQIASDLFAIIDVLQQKGKYHNDLHGDNLIVKRLKENARRADAIDGQIRAVAIDLSSLSDDSKSNGRDQRLGDLHWVSQHLLALVSTLVIDPDTASDQEYRLASALGEIAHTLLPDALSQRTISPRQAMAHIKDTFELVSSPWHESLKLRDFSDSYNAQSLAPWYVPQLIVDPNDHWLRSTSIRGPQVITGMRGCGKTLLLRALQFHARATKQNGEDQNAVLSRLKNDGFIGLYVSSTRLLDERSNGYDRFYQPFAKLYVGYGIEAIRAIRHLQEINPESVMSTSYQEIAQAIYDYVKTPLSSDRAFSIHDLETTLLKIQVSLDRRDPDYSFQGHPSIAFPHFAQAIRKCSPVWNNSYILFLLDDVSTRFLSEPKIEELISVLLFQNEICAFKMTSEAQTLELALRSPGQIESARVGRDYAVFDLGAEVYEKIKKNQKGSGKEFVEAILQRRARYYANHPRATPTQLLGDSSLSSIAKDIVSTTRTSRKKKEIYKGITALARACVGDIGDVITLYELILRKAEGAEWPIPPRIQSECYQDFCSRRLYELNRRGGDLKDFALSFAEASHELLLKSYADFKKNRTKRERLRQYLSIYVRITTGDVKRQYARLRKLIDAGIFVFAGGSEAPRTKTRDSNPTQQFKLTYRKIYGLSNFIGLAESDRFELSGDQLKVWLENPSKGKEILSRNLGGEDIEDQPTNSDLFDENDLVSPAPQPSLFDLTEPRTIGRVLVDSTSEQEVEMSPSFRIRVPSIRQLHTRDLKTSGIDSIIIGLGFEGRTLKSVERLLETINPENAILVQYRQEGFSKDMIRLVSKHLPKRNIKTIKYSKLLRSGLPPIGSRVLVDITGLTKPAIFHGVRNALKSNHIVFIAHTLAKTYYPRDKDLDGIVAADKSLDHLSLLKGLSKVLMGEQGPYVLDALLESDSDQSRRRVLCAFSSPKQERLYSLVEQREYDSIEIVAPHSETPRNRLARIAAETVARNFRMSRIINIDSDDLESVLKFLVENYYVWYTRRGFNYELGLTGSKLQAVACAIVTSTTKVSQCWYVRPRSFDLKRFTKGFRESKYYEISFPQ